MTGKVFRVSVLQMIFLLMKTCSQSCCGIKLFTAFWRIGTEISRMHSGL